MSKASLAIDCSSELCSVALRLDEHLSFKEKLAPREHAYLALPFAEELLTDQGLHFSDLEKIIFARGPGAFTGLRVAASVAQGLALAYEKPLIGFSSLQLLAVQMNQRIALSSGDRVMAVLDARMSELYWACFEKTEQGLLLLGNEHLGSPEKLKEEIVQDAYFIGPGCRHLLTTLSSELCKNLDELEAFCEFFPHAKDLFQLLDAENNEVNHEQTFPFPVYLRNHVADKQVQNSND